MKAILIDLAACGGCYACQESCPTEAISFLDADSLEEYQNDPDYEVMKTRANLPARVLYKGKLKRFIAGTVYDPVKKEALTGAKVTLVHESTSKRLEMETDTAGVFWFTDVAENAYYTLGITYGGKKMAIADIHTVDDVNLGDIAFE